MTEFITYLSGNSEWFPNTSIKASYSDEYTKQIRKILGVSYFNFCVDLYRLCISMPTYSYLFYDSESLSLEGVLAQDSFKDKTILEATGKEPAKSIPADLPGASYPEYTGLTLQFNNNSSALLKTNNAVWTVLCNKTGNILTIKWPDELGISGLINLGDKEWKPGSVIDIPVRWRYPVQLVDKLLRKSNTVFEFLENRNTCELFCSADTAGERICIVIWTLIDYIKENS